MIFTFINFINAFIFALVVAFANILGAVFPKRKWYVGRLIGSVVVFGAAAYFLPVAPTDSFALSLLYAVFMYLFILGLALASVAFCVKGKFVNYLYCAACGYALQHLSSNLTTIASHFYPLLNLDDHFRFEAILTQVVCIAFALVLVLFLVKRNKQLRSIMNRKRVVIIASVIVLVDICFSSSLMLAGNFGYSTYASSGSAFYATATSVLVVIVILSLLKQERLEAEVLVMNALYQENVRQYEVSKATMASLHDIKHTLNAVMDGKYGLTEKQKKNLSDEIFFLDSNQKTGNETLDIIMAEKKMLCHQLGIEFTSMVDGTRLSFIDTYDIFSLFGNALSNAIEAASRVSEGKPRYLSLIVKGTDHFASIHLENTYEGVIRMEEGLPITDKTDANAHGFGVKSIRNITEKYGGNMAISIQGDIFNLDLFFPLN